MQIFLWLAVASKPNCKAMINTDHSGNPCKRGWSGGYCDSNVPEETGIGKGKMEPSAFLPFQFCLLYYKRTRWDVPFHGRKKLHLIKSVDGKERQILVHRSSWQQSNATNDDDDTSTSVHRQIRDQQDLALNTHKFTLGTQHQLELKYESKQETQQKTNTEASKMAQGVQTPAAKPNDLSWIPGTQMVK